MQINATGNLGTCVHVGITGGTVVATGTGTANCMTGGSATESGTVFYNDPRIRPAPSR